MKGVCSDLFLGEGEGNERPAYLGAEGEGW